MNVNNRITKLFIGNGEDERYFNGTINETIIFNRALSSSEISDLYARAC